MRELLGCVAQNFGKGLQKAAAAAGAGFVQKDIIDGTVMDFQALHILSADVQNEIYLRLQILGSIKVCHGFYDTIVNTKAVANQLLAVAGDCTCQQAAGGIFCIEIGKIIADGNNRITLIALVEGVKQFAIWTHNSDFNGRAAGINTDKGFACLRRGADSDTFFRVTLLENGIFTFVFKKRRQMFKAVLRCCCLQLFWQRGKVHLVLCTEGCTHCYIKQAVFRADAFDIQNTVKGITQTAHKGERTAKIQHIAADWTAFGKTGDGLACYSVEDAGCQVAFFRTLVEQRLDIAFGENTAAAGDGVGVLCLLCQLVHLGCFYIQQGSHLVDKGTGASGAAVVHTCVKMAA